MRTTQFTLMAAALLMIAACSSSKKSITSTAAPATAANTTATVAVAPAAPLVARPADGIYPPGPNELAAIQPQYAATTLSQLMQGYSIYTDGACIKCHRAMNIYNFGDQQWKQIMDNMAQKARLTDPEKDAVYKYVLAIRAVKPK